MKVCLFAVHKLTKAIGVFLGDSFGHHASLIDVFQRSQRVSFDRKTVSLDIDICISTCSKLQFCLQSEGWTCWALCRWASRSSYWLSHGVWCPALDSPGTPGLVPTKLDWGEALASSRPLLRRRSKLHMRDGSVQQVGFRGSHGISGAQKDLIETWRNVPRFAQVKADPSFTDSDHLWSFTVFFWSFVSWWSSRWRWRWRRWQWRKVGPIAFPMFVLTHQWVMNWETPYCHKLQSRWMRSLKSALQMRPVCLKPSGFGHCAAWQRFLRQFERLFVQLKGLLLRDL